MTRPLVGALALWSALGCGGLSSNLADLLEEGGTAESTTKGAVVPVEAPFGSWALPEELSRRSRAAGWEVERCDRFDDGGFVTTNCDLRRDGSYAYVAIDELQSVAAAKEQVSFAEDIEAITRDGNLILSARVFDRGEAEAVRDAVVPKGVSLLDVTPDDVRARVGETGWTVTWCDETDDSEYLEIDCEMERNGTLGFLDLDREREPGQYRGEDRVLEGPEAVVDQGHAFLAVEVPDGPGSEALLVALLGADPVEAVEQVDAVAVAPEPVAAPEPPAPEPAAPAKPDPAPVAPAPEPVAVPAPVVAPAPAPAVEGVPVVVTGTAAVVLIDGDERYTLPTAVPTGRYVIEATFPGKAPFEAGKVTVMEGQRASVACRASLGICRAVHR